VGAEIGVLTGQWSLPAQRSTGEGAMLRKGNQPAHWTMFSRIACGSEKSDTCLCSAETGWLLDGLERATRREFAGVPREDL
jgi:hypothetical protein